MDWNDLKYLLALHRGGSLAAAAKELGVSKATISRRLAALEEAARAQLFERTPNGVVITAAGRTVVAAAEEIEQTTASLDARLAAVNDAKPRGIVRFTAPAFIAERFVIPFLPELKSRYPELEVQLVGSNRLLNIAQREADLALRNVRPDQQSLRGSERRRCSASVRPVTTRPRTRPGRLSQRGPLDAASTPCAPFVALQPLGLE